MGGAPPQEQPPNSSTAQSWLRIAGSAVVRIRAEGTEVGVFVGQADKRYRAGMVLSIERSELGDVEHAAVLVGVVRVIEPKADVEGIGRRQGSIGIETKDLIQQNGLDRSLEVTETIGLEIALIPGHSEIGEVRIGGSIGKQITALDGEHVERQVRTEVVAFDRQGIGELATLDVDVSRRRRAAVCGQAGGELRVDVEVEIDDIDL